MHHRTPGKRPSSAARSASAVLLFGLALVATLGLPGTAADGDAAVDTVDAEVRARETVLGTIRPATERESFRITLPAGATLSGSAKPTGDGAPGLALDVRGPDDGIIVSFPATGAKTKLQRLTATVSGDHMVRVCGDQEADGDYRLKLRAKMPRRAKVRSELDLAAGAATEATLGAAAGSTLRVTVSASGGSGLRPRIESIDGPEGFSLQPPAPAEIGKRHVVRDVVLPTTGDYSVRFSNQGAAAGAWTASARLKTPAVGKTTLDITDEALAGEFAGEQAVVARQIDEAGGVVASPLDDEDIAQVMVTIPAGAVSAPAVITMSESDDFQVDDDTYAAGTTIALGPAGLEFSEPVEITVPFDPQSFDDPGTEVLVASQSGDTGEVEVVTGVVDVDAQTVTFETSHFSRFQAASRRPRPLKGAFVELELAAGADAQFAQGVAMGLHEVAGQPGPRTGNAVVRTLDRFGITWAPLPGGRASLAVDVSTQRQNGTVTADQSVTIDLGARQLEYQRGRSGDALVRSVTLDGASGVSVLLRRVKGAPTRGGLSGSWHGFVVETAAVVGQADLLRVVTAGQTFELDVDAKGRATPKDSDLHVTRTAYPGGKPATQRDRREPQRGSLVPVGDLARLTLGLGAEEGLPSVDLYPVVRGDALVGLARRLDGSVDDPTRAVVRLVILVRAGALESAPGSLVSGSPLFGQAALGLSGRSRFGALELGLAERSGAVSSVGLVHRLLRLDVEHDGAKSLRAHGVATVVGHAATGAPDVATSLVDVLGTYRLQSDLSYEESAPLARGALLRRRGLYVVTRFEDGAYTLGFGLPARPLVE